MGNVYNIYTCVGILAGLYLFITKKDSQKSLFMLLLSIIAFYSSAYMFYFVRYPLNLFGTSFILVLWFLILQLVKKFHSGKEQVFWYICIFYVAIYHVLHYVFDPLAEKNVWYAVIFFIYTNAGLITLAGYYVFKVNLKK